MDYIQLTDEELAFLRYIGEITFTAESPLFYIGKNNVLPKSFLSIITSLREKGYLHKDSWFLHETIKNSIITVAECDACIIGVKRQTNKTKQVQYYYREGIVSSYHYKKDGTHFIGLARQETALLLEFAASLKTNKKLKKSHHFNFTSSEFLIISILKKNVFKSNERYTVRDIKHKLDQISDFPASNLQESNQQWSQEVKNLLKYSYVHIDSYGDLILSDPLKKLIESFTSKFQHTYTRYDFIDEEWLLRQIILYQQTGTVIALGTQSDGTIKMSELSNSGLADSLTNVLGHLPDLDTLDMADKSLTDLLTQR